MSQAPGWYKDPFLRDQERYWDGRVWTQGIRPEGTTAAEVSPGVEAIGTAPLAPGAVDSSTEVPSFAALGAPIPPVVVAPATVVAPAGSATLATPAGLGRRHQRLAVLGIGAAALLLVAGGVAAALVLGQPNSASASEAVATAATQTINSQSADMSMSMNMSVMGMQESITATGAFDFADHTGTLTMNIPAGGQQLTEQAIYDGSTVYVNMGGLLGGLAQGLTQGKQWVSADIGQLESGSGGLGGMNAFGNPAAMLQQLQSAGGTVTSLGPTTYDGTSVTEYSVDIPPSVLQGEMGHLPASLQQGLSGVNIPDIKSDVYITSDNLLKAIHMPMSFSAAGQSMSMDMTISFSNYGTPVTVTPPPASEVIPLSPARGRAGRRLRCWEHGHDREHGDLGRQRQHGDHGRKHLGPHLAVGDAKGGPSR